jgi:hypothetical protein
MKQKIPPTGRINNLWRIPDSNRWPLSRMTIRDKQALSFVENTGFEPVASFPNDHSGQASALFCGEYRIRTGGLFPE